MKAARMLAAVREAIKYATLENAEFGSIHRDSEQGRTRPVRNSAGEIVTENNVTEFIRERVRIHHHSWIIGTLESVTQELLREVRHSFVADKHITWLCTHCRCAKEHRSHVK